MTRTAWTSGLPLPPSEVAEMVALAEQGLSRSEIAALTERSYRVVRKYVGHITCGEAGRPADVDRYRRMLRAVSTAGYGDRDGIARRFGLKDADVLRVVLVRARRAVAARDRTRHVGASGRRSGASRFV